MLILTNLMTQEGMSVVGHERRDQVPAGFGGALSILSNAESLPDLVRAAKGATEAPLLSIQVPAHNDAVVHACLKDMRSLARRLRYAAGAMFSLATPTPEIGAPQRITRAFDLLRKHGATIDAFPSSNTSERLQITALYAGLSAPGCEEAPSADSYRLLQTQLRAQLLPKDGLFKEQEPRWLLQTAQLYPERIQKYVSTAGQGFYPGSKGNGKISARPFPWIKMLHPDRLRHAIGAVEQLITYLEGVVVVNKGGKAQAYGSPYRHQSGLFEVEFVPRSDFAVRSRPEQSDTGVPYETWLGQFVLKRKLDRISRGGEAQVTEADLSTRMPPGHRTKIAAAGYDELRRRLCQFVPSLTTSVSLRAELTRILASDDFAKLCLSFSPSPEPEIAVRAALALMEDLEREIDPAESGNYDTSAHSLVALALKIGGTKRALSLVEQMKDRFAQRRLIADAIQAASEHRKDGLDMLNAASDADIFTDAGRADYPDWASFTDKQGVALQSLIGVLRRTLGDNSNNVSRAFESVRSVLAGLDESERDLLLATAVADETVKRMESGALFVLRALRNEGTVELSTEHVGTLELIASLDERRREHAELIQRIPGELNALREMLHSLGVNALSRDDQSSLAQEIYEKTLHVRRMLHSETRTATAIMSLCMDMHEPLPKDDVLSRSAAWYEQFKSITSDFGECLKNVPPIETPEVLDTKRFHFDIPAFDAQEIRACFVELKKVYDSLVPVAEKWESRSKYTLQELNARAALLAHLHKIALSSRDNLTLSEQMLQDILTVCMDKRVNGAAAETISKAMADPGRRRYVLNTLWCITHDLEEALRSDGNSVRRGLYVDSEGKIAIKFWSHQAVVSDKESFQAVLRTYLRNGGGAEIYFMKDNEPRDEPVGVVWGSNEHGVDEAAAWINALFPSGSRRKKQQLFLIRHKVLATQLPGIDHWVETRDRESHWGLGVPGGMVVELPTASDAVVEARTSAVRSSDVPFETGDAAVAYRYALTPRHEDVAQSATEPEVGPATAIVLKVRPENGEEDSDLIRRNIEAAFKRFGPGTRFQVWMLPPKRQGDAASNGKEPQEAPIEINSIGIAYDPDELPKIERVINHRLAIIEQGKKMDRIEFVALPRIVPQQ